MSYIVDWKKIIVQKDAEIERLRGEISALKSQANNWKKIIVQKDAEIERLRLALHKALIFIENEYRSPQAEEWGEWLDKDARKIHAIVVDALYPKGEDET